MPERLDELRDKLTSLVADLRAADSLDPATRRQLEETASEIIALLHRGEPGGPKTPRDGSLGDRLVELEASHPNIAAVVHRLIDLLGQAGI